MSLIIKDLPNLYNQSEGWILFSVGLESSSAPSKFESSKDDGVTWETYSAYMRNDVWEGWGIYLNQDSFKCKVRVTNEEGDISISNTFVVSKNEEPSQIPPEINISNGDFWDLESPFLREYIITQKDGVEMTVEENLNGVVIRTLHNQPSGQKLTIDLSDKWNDIQYGLNIVTIKVTTFSGISLSVVQRFSKNKNITSEISEYESLEKLQKHIQSIGEDIKYLEFDLKGILQTKNIQTTQEDTLTTLIKKVRLLSPK